MVYKLYGAGGRGSKIVAAAKYNNISFEVGKVEMGVTNKTPEFLKMNPTGKVPVLETDEGCIFESNAILRYIARTGGKLYGKSTFEAGLIDQWIDFGANEIELAAAAWLYPIFGFVANNPLAVKKATEDIKKAFQVLDSHLVTRTFFVGNSISIADIALFSSIFNLLKMVLDAAFRKEFTNVIRWFNTILNQPIIKEVYGEFAFCEKTAVAQAPKKEEKEKKPAAPKEAPKPKEEKKPAAAEEDDGEEDYEKEEKKKPNPLDALPKSSFALDEWKRMYSNNDTRSVALPWFFQNIDLNGYSLWWSNYKYNNELTKIFMSSNLITGMFQRLEKAHKYAFGSMLICGEEGNSEITGVWLFRGDKVPEVVTEADDYEHYNWAPVDIKDEKQKKLLEDYFAWDGELGGKKFATGKVFK